MPPRPPRGRGQALVVRATSPRLLVGVLLTALLLVIALFILDLDGIGPTIGPARFAVFGVLGAFAVIAPRYSSYAAGLDWFARGDHTWIDPTTLTDAHVDGGSLRLRDAEQRRLRIPVRVLLDDPDLLAALRQGVHKSLCDHPVDLDDRANDILVRFTSTTTRRLRPLVVSELDDGSSARRS
ncbi:MAG TPA: hypothetical protein VHZ97_28460 [Pseudonocardiaceae bacterium]|nr:hypothetical protein [Pseudonocardiaceae bacterium]